MNIEFKPIGVVKTDEKVDAACWRTADGKGILVLENSYLPGFQDLTVGQYIFVLYYTGSGSKFSETDLRVSHPTYPKSFGVFSTHVPKRPNPIGMAFLEVTKVSAEAIHVNGLDIPDGTPILDIKPDACPWQPWCEKGISP